MWVARVISAFVVGAAAATFASDRASAAPEIGEAAPVKEALEHDRFLGRQATEAAPGGKIFHDLNGRGRSNANILNEPTAHRGSRGVGAQAGKRLSDKSVAEIIKRYAAMAGLDPAIFSGHSLRAGFVTSALEHGADLFKVMDVTRHRRVETLKGHDRRAKAFRDHAGEGFL
jgi:hypothetical protein